MAEKEKVFSSKIKFDGIFNFKDFYKFCYSWLSEQGGLDVSESKYEEKISADGKDISSEGSASKKVTDYFKFDISVKIKGSKLSDVEVEREGKKEKSNKGSVELSVSGTLVRDYDGKFETTPFYKVLRSIYEKWVIPSRIEEYEGKLAGTCDEFLSQARALLELSAKR